MSGPGGLLPTIPAVQFAPVMAKLDIQLTGSDFKLVKLLAESGQAHIYEACTTVAGPEKAKYSCVFKVYKGTQAEQVRNNEQAVLGHLVDCGAAVASPIGLQYRTLAGDKPSADENLGLLFRYLKGQDLSKLLAAQKKKAGFAPDEVATWVVKLCEVLDKVHRNDIVHRDLKPGNILWDEKNQVIWLIDFGSAVFLNGPKCPLSHTPCYSSPQCLAGEPPRQTDDVYSLGITMFELLAGKHQFPLVLNWKLPGDVLAEQLKAGLHALNIAADFQRRGLFPAGQEDLLPRFAKTITRCLHPEPAERFQTVKQVAKALQSPDVTLTASVSVGKPVRAEPLPSKRGNWWGSHRRGWQFGALGMVGLAVAGPWAWEHKRPGIVIPPLVTQLTNSPGDVPKWPSPSAPKPHYFADSTNPVQVLPPAKSIIAVVNTPPSSSPPKPSPQLNPTADTHSGEQAVHVPPSKQQVPNSNSPEETSLLSAAPAPEQRLRFDPAANRYTNSLGMVFVPVDSSRRVWFCIWQTRVADFRKYKQQAGTEFNATLKNLLDRESPELAVREVSWVQADQFCSWLTTNDQNLLPGCKYRLPWEREWTAAVAQNAANSDGLQHMGNPLAEMCQDDYASDSPNKVFCRAGSTGKDNKNTGEEWLGFRCVLAPGSTAGTMVAGTRSHSN